MTKVPIHGLLKKGYQKIEIVFKGLLLNIENIKLN